MCEGNLPLPSPMNASDDDFAVSAAEQAVMRTTAPNAPMARSDGRIASASTESATVVEASSPRLVTRGESFDTPHPLIAGESCEVVVGHHGKLQLIRTPLPRPDTPALAALTDFLNVTFKFDGSPPAVAGLVRRISEGLTPKLGELTNRYRGLHGYWWVKITARSGPPIQRSTGTADKVKAREYHDKLKASVWDQERLGIKPQRSWREAVVRWLEETSHKATHGEDKKKLVWLHPFLGDLSLDEVTLDVIDRVRSAKLKDASKATVNRYLALVRAILIRARDEWEWIERAPTFRGKPINQANTKAWQAAKQRAGIDDFRWHDLRHTWATWQRQAGTPTHELQQLGGWKTGAMVERYAHLAPDHLADAARRLDRVLLATV